MHQLYAKYRKIFWYLFSGGTATLVNLTALAIFVSVFHIWYIIGTTLSFLCAFGVGFTLQKFLTFREHSTTRVRSQMGGYLLINLCNLVVNGLLMYIAVDKIGLHYLIAQIFVSATIASYSFFLYKHLIFERRRKEI